MKNIKIFIYFIFMVIKSYNQNKDILEIARVNIPKFSLIQFSNNGLFAIAVNQNTGNLELLDTKSMTLLKTLKENQKDEIQNLCFSPNSHLVVVTNKEEFELWSVDSLKYIFSFPRKNSNYVTFSLNSQNLVIVRPDNFFEIIDLATKKSITYKMPIYIDNKTYKSELVQCIFNSNDNIIYLADVGFASEISTFKTGLHINVLPFDITNQKYLKPIEIFFSTEKNYTKSDFSKISITPDGNFFIFCLKNKILYYNIINKKIKEATNIEVVENVTFDSSGKYILTSGLNTTTLWEITTNNTVRQLKKFIGGTNILTFTPKKKYIITLSPQKNQLIAWDIKEALLIRTIPTEYVKRSSQKLAKIKMLNYLIKNKKEKQTDYLERISEENKKIKAKNFLSQSLNNYCKEVFEIGIDYLLISKEDTTSNILSIKTEGFAPIHFITEDNKENKKFLEYFTKGAYKWKKMEFGISGDNIIITKAILHMNYAKEYIYNIEEDYLNNISLEKIDYIDYDLNEKYEVN